MGSCAAPRAVVDATTERITAPKTTPERKTIAVAEVSAGRIEAAPKMPLRIAKARRLETIQHRGPKARRHDDRETKQV